jgi:predicted HTH domain antitoxin
VKTVLKKLVLEFPPEVLEEDLQDRDVQMKAREGAVMELLRKGKLSQGRAAELLDISRNDLFDLMTKYDIPVTNMSQDELKKELSKQVLEK